MVKRLDNLRVGNSDNRTQESPPSSGQADVHLTRWADHTSSMVECDGYDDRRTINRYLEAGKDAPARTWLHMCRFCNGQSAVMKKCGLCRKVT